ncbi:pyridoxal-phosphate-dependent aminotransferase family protein [Clostridium ganghwense]|uniref:Alanine--glyoxylate aminotransferase family protein n=1 Tax=Clostridium ganghwense TaxID=312089 RepID=A0ABT4CMC4_9CLOT|nr:alanine--glyoxylate aminotransferase family protein [Clostridium ganghwense]MCY6370208.1 alanine--glyoxylate aminotransferase family protein [Clostridium ganghwense]
MGNKLLMTPGPTNVPDRVLKKMSEGIIHHRTSEYSGIFKDISENLKYVYQTKNAVLTFTSSGTGGLEAAVVNMFSKGDKVLAVTIGVFGDRFINIAKLYGLDVDVISVPWGKGVTVEEIKDKLCDEHKALILTHNDTSTAAVNPIKEIGEFMKDKKQLFMVDGVSSIGGIEAKMDEWNIDVLVTGSQKALMIPPGLCFVGVSDKGWKAAEKSTLPKYYFDFKSARDYLEKPLPQNPYTPAVPLVIAANEALKMIKEEGLYNVYERHQNLAGMVRNEVEKMGLTIYTDKKYLSNTVTAITFNDDTTASRIKKRMEEEFDIIIAGGQRKLKGKMIRIGHMGCVNKEMVERTLDALKKCL